MALAALIAPTAASAAPCSVSGTSGTETTYSCNVPTGTIGGYEVKQWTPGPVPNPGVTGYITKMQTDIIDDVTGEPVPISRLMLHHIVFLNVLRQDTTCHSYTGFDGRDSYGNVAPQRFYAAGEERMKMAMPPGYGYKTNAGDVWGLLAMVMNHRATADHALIHYDVTVDSAPLAPVTPYWLDVRDCQADPIYNVPGVDRAVATAKKKHKKKKRSAKSSAKHKKKHKKKKRTTPTATAPTYTEMRDYTFPQSGRIVAGIGHVHGGAVGLTLSEPNCGNREVARSDPTWGLPDHPFYNVKPVLHEPGPINMSAFRSTSGIPVNAGEKIRLNSIYDDASPHVRVMGIFIVYLAPDAGVTQNCGPVPPLEILKTDQPGRTGVVPFTIPLTGLDAQGQAQTIDGPPGSFQDLPSGSTIPVGDRFFGVPNVRVTKGSTLNWRFSGAELHNLTTANGPLGIGTGNLDGNRTFSQKFDRPGTYRFFCALHPVQMSERVVVTDGSQKHKKKKKKKRRH
jgi:plastocyanin